MKMLLVASFPDSIIRFRGVLIDSVKKNSCQVHVAAPGLCIGSGYRDALERIGVIVHDIPLQRANTNVLSDAALFLRMLKLIRAIGPDLVLSYTAKPVIYGTLASWIARVPRRFALISGLGFVFTGERTGPLKLILTSLYRLALARANGIFFQNQDDLELFRSLSIIGQKANTIIVNGSGIDLNEYPSSETPDGQLRFLMIGRLLGDKGVREYVMASKRVRILHPDVKFTLAGWIDDNPDRIDESELDEWISNGDVEYLGRLDDVRPVLDASSVYVLPSYREGTPRTVLEAMATGRPIITTDAPGCRETVVDGDNGYLVPVKSVDALAEAMLRFIEQPYLVARMGRRSREIAEEKYDVHKVNAVMLREMGINNECPRACGVAA